MSIITFLKDIISPKKCYSCKKEGYFFCPDCMEQIENFSPFCYVCRKHSDNFLIHASCAPASTMSQILVYGKYRNTHLKKLIHDGKFYGRKEVYKDLAIPLSEMFLENHIIDNKDDYIIIGAPMYFFRTWKRGYNQSNILAQHIGHILDIDFSPNIIIKKKGTKPQSHLGRNDRLVNLKNTLKLNTKYKDYIKGKTIIIIDDVISTGSTLSEIAGILKISGAKNIVGLVIASE